MAPSYSRVPDEGDAPPLPPKDEHELPPLYYGQRNLSMDTFVSSELDESERKAFVEREGEELDDLEDGRGEGVYHPQPPSRKLLPLLLFFLLLSAALIGALSALSYNRTYTLSGLRRLDMDAVFNGTFSAQRKSVAWVDAGGRDGVYGLRDESGGIVLVELGTGENRTLVKGGEVKDEFGRQIGWDSYYLAPDESYILFRSSTVKQWRHSTLATYHIHSLGTHTTLSLPTPASSIALALWSPTGHALAYVHENDVYVLSQVAIDAAFASGSGSAEALRAERVTFDGSDTVFNGLNDWVYEEEVYSSPTALWWSPDGAHVAFLRLNETAVRKYSFPIYNPHGWDANQILQYPQEVTMRYPKPSTPNPLATLHSYTLSSNISRVLAFPSARDERIIFSVSWLTPSVLLAKETSRDARDGSGVRFVFSSSSSSEGGTEVRGETVRDLVPRNEKGEADGGWIDHAQTVEPLGGKGEGEGEGEDAYLDVVPDEKGFNHLALFSPSGAEKPVWLTRGGWEVESMLGVDRVKGVVYFCAAHPTPLDRHILSIPLPSPLSSASTAPLPAPTALTDVAHRAVYGASFSPRAGWYVLSYEGPDVPWQRVVKIGDGGKEEEGFVLEDNRKLNETSASYESPLVVRTTVVVDGFELQAMEIRPPGMDDTGRRKYPVLFRVYGGPGSQLVSLQFARDWHHYLACTLKYIVVVVDGRGTGYAGRHLRNQVAGQLGTWEVHDQVETAREWARKKYVDAKKIGIWGWSYGGYMTTKTLEANSGIFSLGIAVAPVTDWALYDSIYTERYMSTPALNADGYATSAVHNVTGFKDVDFALAHGSGDDNVHYAHTAHLLDLLTFNQIRNFRFRMFTDSDHSISKRGAYRELHEWMTQFLEEKWGRGGKRRGGRAG